MPAVHGAFALLQDADGDLWIAGSSTLVRWNTSSSTTFEPSGLKNNYGDGITALAAGRDGTIWVGIISKGPGLGLQQLNGGRWQAFRTSELDGESLVVTALHLDSEGALWVGTIDSGVYRIFETPDHFDSSNGLSSDLVQSVRSDHEGNIWVVTNQESTASAIRRSSSCPTAQVCARRKPRRSWPRETALCGLAGSTR